MNSPPVAAEMPLEMWTARLHIRCLTERDEPLFVDLYTDADTMALIGPPLPQERALNAFNKALSLTRARPTRYIYFSISEKGTGDGIGICSVQKLDPVERSAEVGIMLNARGRKKGLSQEALGALIAWTFATLPVDDIRIEFSVEHAAARRVAAGLGFEFYGNVAANAGYSNTETWHLCRQR